MNVGELIAKLSELDPGLLVVTPENAEANYYSADACVSQGWFTGNSEFWVNDEDDEDGAYEPDPDDVPAVAIY